MLYNKEIGEEDTWQRAERAKITVFLLCQLLSLNIIIFNKAEKDRDNNTYLMPYMELSRENSSAYDVKLRNYPEINYFGP